MATKLLFYPLPVTEDVWYEKDTETGERTDVTYSEDILNQMEEDNDDEEDQSSSE